MINDTLSAETNWIISQLVQFRGAAAMHIVARCFPQFAPAQGGAGFRQLQYDFACNHVPEALAMPVDADDITLTVQGDLGDAAAKPELKKAVEDVFEAPSFSTGWDVRVYFDSRPQSGFRYQIKVYTTPHC